MKAELVRAGWLLALVLVAGGATQSPRSTVLLRQGCESTLGGWETTLFGNGTVRLKQQQDGKESMYLGELTSDEVEALVRRLRRLDLSESPREFEGARGEWIEGCELELNLPGQERELFRFGAHDTLSLEVNRIVGIVQEVTGRAELRSGVTSLPLGYEPQPGDRLRRHDGLVFEVLAVTVDGKGVELHGVDQPLVLYVAKDSLGEVFVALLSAQED